MVRRALLPGVVTFLAASTSLATPHTAFLDFDHDHDLWTITPLSPQWEDTVTVILQAGDDPLRPGDMLGFMQTPAICYYDDGHGGGYEFCGVMTSNELYGWCNQTLFDFCEFMMGTGEGCEPPLMWFTVAPGVVFEPGERYFVCRLMARTGPHSCPFYLDAEYMIGAGNHGVTNRVWLAVDPASVGDDSGAPAPRTVESTWGALKQSFR